MAVVICRPQSARLLESSTAMGTLCASNARAPLALVLLLSMICAALAEAPLAMDAVESPSDEHGAHAQHGGGSGESGGGGSDDDDGFDLKFVEAESAGSMRFSKRYRDKMGESYALWSSSNRPLLDRVLDTGYSLALDALQALVYAGVVPIETARRAAALVQPPSLWLPVVLCVALWLSLLLARVLWWVLVWCLAHALSWRAHAQLHNEADAADAAVAAAAKVKRDTVLAAEAARLAAVGTVRTCRFCDVEVPLDEHVEAHVRGKKHKKNALAHPSFKGDVADCWFWRESEVVKCKEVEPERNVNHSLNSGPVEGGRGGGGGGRWQKAKSNKTVAVGKPATAAKKKTSLRRRNVVK